MSTEPRGQTLLHESVTKSDYAGVDKAIELGAKINLASETGYPLSALHLAVDGENPDMVEYLIERGANIELPYTAELDGTPLLMAAKRGDVETMQVLLKHHADVNARACEGYGIRVFAARAMKNADKVWDLLMKPETGLHSGQHPSDSENGPSTWLWALTATTERKDYRCDSKVIAALIRHGSNWKALNDRGETFLHELLRLCEPGKWDHEYLPDRRAYFAEVIQHAFEAGASPFIVDAQGLSAYGAAIAAKDTMPEIVQVFRAAAAPVAERAQHFTPARDVLFNPEGKPVALVYYCCAENMLGELLATHRWPSTEKLLQAKQELSSKLAPVYQEQFSAELDTTSLIRGSVTKSVLKRFAATPSSFEKG